MSAAVRRQKDDPSLWEFSLEPVETSAHSLPEWHRVRRPWHLEIHFQR